jgi:hypothetical protein
VTALTTILIILVGLFIAANAFIFAKNLYEIEKISEFYAGLHKDLNDFDENLDDF